MTDFAVIHKGVKSDEARALQAAHNRRVHARGLDTYRIAEDGVLTDLDLLAIRKDAWVLGSLTETFEAITHKHEVSIGVQRMIRNPGLRSDQQLKRAHARLSQLRALQHKREQAAKEHAEAQAHRVRIATLAEIAALHYRQDPGAYHYLAGGEANLIFLAPTPRTWRSDCSQFAGSVYDAAGLPSPANVPAMWASTYSIAPHGTLTTNPRMGDLGMYGSRTAPHHVEIYIGKPGEMFIGHGSPPIDSLTPGWPDYFLTYSFLDGAVKAQDMLRLGPGDFKPDPDYLEGEKSRFEDAALQGVVSRDYLPEIDATSVMSGFGGGASGTDDQIKVDHDVTHEQIASL